MHSEARFSPQQEETESTVVDGLTEWVSTLDISVDRQKELAAFYRLLSEKSPIVQKILSKDHFEKPDIEVLVKMRFLSKLLLQVNKWKEIHSITTNEEIEKQDPPTLLRAMQTQSELASNALTHLRTSIAGGIESVTLTDLMPDAFRMFGGTVRGVSNFFGDYEVYARIEEDLFSEIPHEVLQGESFYGAWEIQRDQAFDLEVKKSIGRQGLLGRFENFMEKDGRLVERGDRKLKKLVKQLENKAVKEKRKLPRPMLKLQGRPRLSLRHHSDLVDKVREVMGADNRTDTQKFQEICAMFEDRRLTLPKNHLSTLQRIQKTSTLEDVAWDAKRDLKTVNILWLLGMLQPTASELLPKHGVFDAQHPVLNSRNLQVLVDQNPEAVELLLRDVEADLLHVAPHIDPAIVLENLETISMFLQGQATAEATEHLLDPDTFGEQLLELYPPSVREELIQLDSVENENLQPWSDIMEEAELLYQQRRLPENANHVYWIDHPDAQSLQQMGESLLQNPQRLSTGRYFEGVLPAIYSGSIGIFYDYEYVSETLFSVHSLPADSFAPHRASVYFADYFQLIFNYAQEHQQPIPPEELLAFGLLRNNGDMHLALWDVAIATKLFTRNNLADGSFIEDRTSGWLATRYLVDYQSQGATALDLAEVLPLSDHPQFSNIAPNSLNNSTGDKDYDVANLAGQSYHAWNIAAMAGEFPTSMLLAGMLNEFFNSSGRYGEYGERRVAEQVRYILDHAAGLNDWITEHRVSQVDITSTPSDQLFIIRQDAFNSHFSDSTQEYSFLTALYSGSVVSLEIEGRMLYAALRGSEANPYILLAPTQESVRSLQSFSAIQAAVFLNQDTLDEVGTFQVVNQSDIDVRIDPIAEDVANIIAVERILSRNRQNEGQSSVIEPSEITETLTNYFLNMRNAEAYEFLFAHPELFNQHISEQEFATFLTPERFSYFFPNIEAWKEVRSVSDQHILDVLVENNSNWVGIVAKYPDLFGAVLTEDQFYDIFNSDAFSDYLRSYEDWNHYFPQDPETLLERARMTGSFVDDLVLNNIETFSSYISLNDFFSLLPKMHGSELFAYYVDHKEQFAFVLTDEELLGRLKDVFTHTWGEYVMRAPELFGHLMTQQDLVEALHAGGGYQLLENLENWSTVFDLSPDTLYEGVKDSTNNWGDLVTTYPEFFRSAIPSSDLAIIVRSFGGYNIATDFPLWSEIFQIDGDQFRAVLEAEGFSDVIDAHPELFENPGM